MKSNFRKTLATAILAMFALTSMGQGKIISFDNPKMTVFLPTKDLSNGKAIIDCPGGGYSHLATGHEGFDWAPFYNDLGFAYAVLEYTMPKGDSSVPFADVEKAFTIMTDSATNWGIDPKMIGIMGSSAGGHLASTYATKAKGNLRPAFQILFYPVITMEAGVTHQGSRENLIGKNPTQDQIDNYSNEKQVTSETSPAFIVLSGDDKAVPPANSLRYFDSLQKAGVPSMLHIYPTGGHGWGYRNNFKYHDRVKYELSSWLKEL